MVSLASPSASRSVHTSKVKDKKIKSKKKRERTTKESFFMKIRIPPVYPFCIRDLGREEYRKLQIEVQSFLDVHLSGDRWEIGYNYLVKTYEPMNPHDPLIRRKGQWITMILLEFQKVCPWKYAEINDILGLKWSDENISPVTKDVDH